MGKGEPHSDQVPKNGQIGLHRVCYGRADIRDAAHRGAGSDQMPGVQTDASLEKTGCDLRARESDSARIKPAANLRNIFFIRVFESSGKDSCSERENFRAR